MDGIIPTQKSASVQPVMGTSIQMVTPRRDVTIPRFNAICAVLGLVMILAERFYHVRSKTQLLGH